MPREPAFHSWPVVLLGAVLFAGLFALMAMLSDLLFDGVLRVTPRVLSFGALAFVGYLGVSALIRYQDAAGDD